MVNIKYYVDGKKVLENEYQNTSVTNINDIIYGKYLDTNCIYEIIFTRHYKKSHHQFVMKLFMIYIDRWILYEPYKSRVRKYISKLFDPLSDRDSEWKLYLNKKSNLKFVEVKTEVIDRNNLGIVIPNFAILMEREEDLESLRVYKDMIVEVEKLTLNEVEIDGLKYEDFLNKNLLVRNITIVKSIDSSIIKKTSDYCVIC